MNPQQEQLDPQVVNLAKAIRAVETRGQKDPYSARGGSGEYGAYQFTKPTWDKASQETFGQVVPLESATREQQNQVAYKQLKSFKDQGYNVGQIASMWNSGKPDAYLDTNYKGVNKSGVKFDVPAYAKAVAESYQSIKNSGEPTVAPVSPSTVGHEQYATPEETGQKAGFLGTKPNDSLYGKIIDNSITRGIQNFFPGKRIGQAIGTLGGYAATKVQEDFNLPGAVQGQTDAYDLSAPTPLQVAGDSASALLMAAPGLPGLSGATTALGRIGQAALSGAAYGTSNSLAEGNTNVGQIAKDTAIGGAIGGGVGATSELVQKVAQTFPKWIARKFIGSPASDESIEYAVKKGLGSPTKMLEQSDDSIKSLGKQLEQTLKSKQYSKVKMSGPKILDEVIEGFPDSGLTKAQLISNLKKIAPLKGASIDRLARGSFTLKELHDLNSAIGKNTFKTVFDDPAVKAGKDLGNAFYQNVSNRIKTAAPETVPLFEDLSKEYPLRTALEKLIKRTSKAKAFNMFEIMAVLGGHVFGGVPGSLGVLAGEKALRNPTVNLKAAGLISNLGGPTADSLRQGLQGPVLNASNALMQNLMNKK